MLIATLASLEIIGKYHKIENKSKFLVFLVLTLLPYWPNISGLYVVPVLNHGT